MDLETSARRSIGVARVSRKSRAGSPIAPVKWLSGFGKRDWTAVGDFDGDGKADVPWYEAWNDHAVTVGRSSGGGFVWSGAWGAPDRAFTGDFDGDGQSDLGWYESWNDDGITVGVAR